jgi:UDP-N-acetylmuramoylalanine--D-glutamate ligase
MQNKSSCAFIENKNRIIDKILNKKKINSKVLRVDEKIFFKFQKLIRNNYLNNSVNQKNLIFIFNICNFLKINLRKIIPTLNKFKALKFRNEIVINNKKIKVINDSKSTSFSSTQELIDTKKKTFWILGGLPKKGDKFTLSKKCCLNLRAYIFGKNSDFFAKRLKDKVRYQKFYNMFSAMKKIKIDLKKEQKSKEKIILFSPASASFDNFKNFEERGRYFNSQLRKIGIDRKK